MTHDLVLLCLGAQEKLLQQPVGPGQFQFIRPGWQANQIHGPVHFPGQFQVPAQTGVAFHHLNQPLPALGSVGLPQTLVGRLHAIHIEFQITDIPELLENGQQLLAAASSSEKFEKQPQGALASQIAVQFRHQGTGKYHLQHPRLAKPPFQLLHQAVLEFPPALLVPEARHPPVPVPPQKPGQISGVVQPVGFSLSVFSARHHRSQVTLHLGIAREFSLIPPQLQFVETVVHLVAQSPHRTIGQPAAKHVQNHGFETPEDFRLEQQEGVDIHEGDFLVQPAQLQKRIEQHILGHRPGKGQDAFALLASHQLQAVHQVDDLPADFMTQHGLVPAETPQLLVAGHAFRG